MHGTALALAIAIAVAVADADAVAAAPQQHPPPAGCHHSMPGQGNGDSQSVYLLIQPTVHSPL